MRSVTIKKVAPVETMRLSLVVGLGLSFLLGSSFLIREYGLSQEESPSLPAEASLSEYVIPDPYQSLAGDSDVQRLSEDKLAAAETFWRRRALRDSTDGTAHYHVANALLSRGEYQAAEAAYRRAIAYDPTNAITHKNLAIILIFKGEAPDERLELLRESARLAPNAADIAAVLARELQYQGYYDEATNAFAQAIRLDSGNDQLYLLMGQAFHAQKKYEAAATAYRDAIRLAPDNDTARRSLAEALYRQGQVEEAIAIDRKVNYYIGDEYRIYEQYSAAAVNYREAVRLNPDFAEAYIKLSVTLHDLGKTDEAEAFYKQAIEKVESDPQPGRPFVQHLYDSYSLLLSEQSRDAEAAAIQARSPYAQPPSAQLQ